MPDDKYTKVLLLFALSYVTLSMFPPSLLRLFYAQVSRIQHINHLLSDVVSCIGVEPSELIQIQISLFKIVVSFVYFAPACLLLIVAHIPFEGQAAKLRYPDYGWSPLSIGGNSAVVKIAREIVDVVKDLDLFKGLAACIQQSDECPMFKLVFSPTS